MIIISSGNEGNTSTSDYQGGKSSEASEFSEECTQPAESASEEPPNKKMRRGPANVKAASRRRVDRAVAATREFIRQHTTHLTQNKKAEVQNNIAGCKEYIVCQALGLQRSQLFSTLSQKSWTLEEELQRRTVHPEGELRKKKVQECMGRRAPDLGSIYLVMPCSSLSRNYPYMYP